MNSSTIELNVRKNQAGYLDEFTVITSTIEGNLQSTQYNKNGKYYVMNVEVKDGQRNGKRSIER